MMRKISQSVFSTDATFKNNIPIHLLVRSTQARLADEVEANLYYDVFCESPVLTSLQPCPNLLNFF